MCKVTRIFSLGYFVTLNSSQSIGSAEEVVAPFGGHWPLLMAQMAQSFWQAFLDASCRRSKNGRFTQFCSGWDDNLIIPLSFMFFQVVERKDHRREHWWFPWDFPLAQSIELLSGRPRCAQYLTPFNSAAPWFVLRWFLVAARSCSWASDLGRNADPTSALIPRRYKTHRCTGYFERKWGPNGAPKHFPLHLCASKFYIAKSM